MKVKDIEPGLYEHENVRVVVKHDEFTRSYSLYVVVGNYHDTTSVVTMDDGSLLMRSIPEGAALANEDLFCAWSENEDITGIVTSIFTALGQVFGITGDAKDSYERGILQGENNVLNRWVTEQNKVIRAAVDAPVHHVQTQLFDPEPYGKV